MTPNDESYAEEVEATVDRLRPQCEAEAEEVRARPQGLDAPNDLMAEDDR